MSYFPKKIIQQRFARQGGRCALCGKELVYVNYRVGYRGAWHAHHIDGIDDHISMPNCACVCVSNPNCHLNIAHGGAFKKRILAPKGWYRLNGWPLSELWRIKRKYYQDVIEFHRNGYRNFFQLIADSIYDSLDE